MLDTGFKIECRSLFQEFDEDSRALSYTVHRCEVLTGGIKNPLDSPEAVKQRFGNRLNVPLGNGIGQKQFDELIIVKPVKSRFDKSFTQPLPMSLMGILFDRDAHVFSQPVVVTVDGIMFKPLLNFFNNSKANKRDALKFLSYYSKRIVECAVERGKLITREHNYK